MNVAPVEIMSSRRRYLVLLILFLSYVMYALDRTVTSVVAEPLKKAFDLSDSQVGLLSLAYGAPLAIASPLLGRLVDRCNRAKLLALALSIWSALTAFCGIAPSYPALVAARVGIGATEASATPAGLAIVSDLFPPQQRATAIGFYKAGVPLGMFLASSVCGYVAMRYGWRSAFFVAGVPGLILAFVIVSYVPDPLRGALDLGGKAELTSIRDAMRFIAYSPGVASLIIGIATFAFANGGGSAFATVFLQRSHGLSLAEAGAINAIGLAIGAVSPLLSGLIADYLSRYGQCWTMYLSTTICLLTASASFMMLTSSSIPVVGIFMVIWNILAVGLTAPSYAALLTVTPAGIRGTVISVVLVGVNFIGFGMGPYSIGMISDWTGGGAAGLRTGMFCVLSVNLIAALCFLFSGRAMSSVPRLGVVG